MLSNPGPLRQCGSSDSASMSSPASPELHLYSARLRAMNGQPARIRFGCSRAVQIGFRWAMGSYSRALRPGVCPREAWRASKPVHYFPTPPRFASFSRFILSSVSPLWRTSRCGTRRNISKRGLSMTLPNGFWGRRSSISGLLTCSGRAPATPFSPNQILRSATGFNRNGVTADCEQFPSWPLSHYRLSSSTSGRRQRHDGIV